MKHILRQAITSLIDINEQDCNLLISLFEFNILDKDDKINEIINSKDSIVFIETGILKKAVLNKKGDESISCFFEANQFFTFSVKKLNGEICNGNIQSIGKSKIYSISKKNLEKLSKKIKGVFEFIRKISENFAAQLENRIYDLMKPTADSKYLKFKLMYPELFLSISKQHLASYLGISPQHFSRLIKKNQLSIM